MSPLARLLVVDDEEPQMQALCATLEPAGYVTRGFTTARAAVAALREEPFDLLLTDLMMPEIDGITLLRVCQEIDRDIACIVMTGHGTIATAVDALQAGALDFVLKPFKLNQLLPALTRALAARRLQLENLRLRESLSIYELSRAITQSLGTEEVVQCTLEAAAGLSDLGAAYLLLPQGEATLRLAGSRGANAHSLEPASLQMSAAARAWLQQVGGAPQAAADGGGELLYAHPFDRHIAVALPLWAGGSCYGVLGFSSARPQRRLNPGQLRALEVLARTAATAFATAALLGQLRQMNEQLEVRVSERTRELESANHDLEAFSYSVSHDLREPLRAVTGFCDMFRSEFADAVPEAGQKVLQRIWSGAERMTQLIDDLLHFARFTRQPLARARVPLRELTLQLLARLRESLGARALTVEVGALPDCYGDAALLEQVLVNLLSNAFKFTAGREVGHVEVGALRQGAQLVYFVRDNGVGFDMRYADKLFGVFQRLHPPGAFEGTGIGLSIVHRIITRHGGRVWADSRPQQGSCFYFCLPGDVPDSAQGTQSAA